MATRTELVELGVERFPLKGYASTSVDDLLRDTHHSKGGFYHHFGSKEEFFLAVMRRRGEMMEETWLSLDMDVETLEEGLAAADVWLRSSAGAMPDMLMLAEFRFAVRDNRDAQKELAALYGRWVRQLSVLVDALSSRGLVREDRSSVELASTIYHLTDGYVVHGAVFGSDRERLLSDLVRLLRP